MTAKQHVARSERPPLRWAARTDVGRVRQENQDAWFADPESGLFLVADGMGGHQAGALAARVVAAVLPAMIQQRLHRLRQPRARAVRYWLRQAIVELTKRLTAESQTRADLAGMGATLVTVLLQSPRTAHVAHMGDSRAYLVCQRRLLPLTEDHSLVSLLLRAGSITAEEALDHPARGQLTRYIGMQGLAYPDIRTIVLSPGDRLLLCSDGLGDVLTDQTIAEILARGDEPANACQSLVDAANAAGGRDNITALVIEPGGVEAVG